MPKFPRRNPRLGDRDYEILSHVMRYRITTPEVLHRMTDFVDSERNAVTKVTSRLCEHGFLLSHPLYKSYTYFTLGRNGARVMGLPSRRVGPLGPQALYREYAMLAFCCLTPTARERMRVSELQRRFPEYVEAGVDVSCYYLDHLGGTDFPAYLWAEAGGDVKHVFDTLTDKITSHCLHPLLRQRINEGRFVATVITYDAEKRDEIAESLKRLRFRIYVRVEVIPELIHLLPSRP